MFAQLQKGIEERVRGHAEPVEVDMLAWMTRTALELIGQAGLGYSFDPLVADSPDEFALAVKSFGYAHHYPLFSVTKSAHVCVCMT